MDLAAPGLGIISWNQNVWRKNKALWKYLGKTNGSVSWVWMKHYQSFIFYFWKILWRKKSLFFGQRCQLSQELFTIACTAAGTVLHGGIGLQHLLCFLGFNRLHAAHPGNSECSQLQRFSMVGCQGGLKGLLCCFVRLAGWQRGG